MWPFKKREETVGGPCKALSGRLWGYRCDLEKGHELPHKATVSVTTNGWGKVVGRTTVEWPSRVILPAEEVRP